uniref:Cytochrome b6-f complex subunit PetP n=1 Tax=Heterorhabditis bacteriophora TaxID=37862 RepID=A0A1I7WP97_HETBA
MINRLIKTGIKIYLYSKICQRYEPLKILLIKYVYITRESLVIPCTDLFSTNLLIQIYPSKIMQNKFNRTYKQYCEITIPDNTELIRYEIGIYIYIYT